jgi:hypothetical protein
MMMAPAAKAIKRATRGAEGRTAGRNPSSARIMGAECEAVKRSYTTPCSSATHDHC